MYSNNKKMSEEEVDAYLALKRKSARNVAIGSVFCIYSVLPMLIILYLLEAGKSAFDFTNGLLLGFVPAVCMVFIGVIFFVMNLKSSAAISKVEESDYDLTDGLRDTFRSRESVQRSKSVNMLIVGLGFTIMSSFPIIYISLKGFTLYRLYAGVSVSVFLLGIGVYQIVKSLVGIDSYKYITSEGDRLREIREVSLKSKRLSQIYWPIVVGMYLVWSVSSMDWHITWIIWPFTGLLFSVLVGLMRFRK